MEKLQIPPCFNDNRLRQLAAWLLYPAPDDDKPADCLMWLIEQPAGTVFRAVMFRAVNLPVYGRDSWFLIGWREKSPTFPRLIEPLPDCQLDSESVSHLLSGAVVRLETMWRGGFWDVAVV